MQSIRQLAGWGVRCRCLPAPLASPARPAACPTCWPAYLPARLSAENEQEDFLLSSYDATCSLTPASARALLAGDCRQAMHFRATYLPMGHMPAVVEAGVVQERLRPAPAGSSPFAVFGSSG
jgi:hypothetical protein